MKKARHVRVSAAVVAVSLSALLGCSPSQPLPTPQEKLRTEIQGLENSISANEYVLRQSVIEIQQKREDMKYEVAKAINEAQASGMDVETVRTQKVTELTDDLKIHIEVYKAHEQLLQEVRNKLEGKRKELQQLAGGDPVSRAPQQ